MDLSAGSEHLARRVETLIRLALEEDLPEGDVTTEAVLDPDLAAAAFCVTRQRLVLSGMDVARRVFETIDADVKWKGLFRDGEEVEAETVISRLDGRAASILAGERTALNFLQHLSGIATATSRMIALVHDLPVSILDTRKTLPGWRLLEKAAVKDGGGTNHRFSLSDSVLIKDNHVALGGGVAATVRRARSRLKPGTRIEVETTTAAEVREALEAGADVILIDNATPESLAEAVGLAGGRADLEVSGGIRESNVRTMARTGIAMISVGALTHSARAVDISMEIA